MAGSARCSLDDAGAGLTQAGHDQLCSIDRYADRDGPFRRGGSAAAPGPAQAADPDADSGCRDARQRRYLVDTDERRAIARRNASAALRRETQYGYRSTFHLTES